MLISILTDRIETALILLKPAILGVQGENHSF